MTTRFWYIIYPLQVLWLLLMFAACSDEVEQEPQDVDFCVRAAWQDGLGGDLQRRGASRALTATDILLDGTEDIVIGTADYPVTIDVRCSDGTDFTLTKGSALCGDHGEYWQYTPSEIYKDKKIERDNLTFVFTATIDDGDVLSGTANQAAISEKTSANQRHMLVELHHTKALLRFAFKVSEDYDKLRFIRVTGINLNGTPCYVKDAVLNKTNMTLIGYAYIDPAVVTTSYENTILCTYNIYDKDEATDAHLTRKGVVAKNKFTLGSLKKADGVTPVSTIEAGYYYDLKVTLDPTYLYVMAWDDNKQHITIE